MKIVATTSLPAVDRPTANRWNAARLCQLHFEMQGGIREQEQADKMRQDQETECQIDGQMVEQTNAQTKGWKDNRSD